MMPLAVIILLWMLSMSGGFELHGSIGSCPHVVDLALCIKNDKMGIYTLYQHANLTMQVNKIHP